MAKKLHVHFVLDETGSMMTVYDATISGFNEYVDTLKRGKAKVVFSLTQFNSARIHTPYVDADLKDVPALSKETYQPNNNTPLYDAVARAIRETEKTANGKALIVVQTDGQENASKEYTLQSIRALIDKKRIDGWEFAFLGADQDAWVVGQAIGVPMASTLSYDQTSTSTRQAFHATAAANIRYAAAPMANAGNFYAGQNDIRTKKKRNHPIS